MAEEILQVEMMGYDGSELDILKIVTENEAISQRKIAEQTGISLGQVNFLIKKCVKKGLIKIEGQTSKSLRYNLTPKGMAEKAERTLEYIKVSYAAVIKITNKIKELGEKYAKEGCQIYVLGSEDEMMEICRLALSDAKVKYRVLRLDSENIVLKKISEERRSAILYWQADVEEELYANWGDKHFAFINVLG